MAKKRRTEKPFPIKVVIYDMPDDGGKINGFDLIVRRILNEIRQEQLEAEKQHLRKIH